MKNAFTANGFDRWMSGRQTGKRDAALAKVAGRNAQSGLFGRILFWLKVELACLRRTKKEKEKASPKILW
jgi:hypothetical protein